MLARYADDFVIGFARETDARRVMDVLPKRFEKHGLTLHPTKTKLIDFRKPPGDGPGPGGFDLLGFTHFWERSRNQNWVIKRKTAKSRFSRALDRISQWCRGNQHQPVLEQHKALGQKLKGHYGYFGIVGNSRSLGRFKFEVIRIWRRWLVRRSSASRPRWRWQRFNEFLRRNPLPAARVVQHLVAKPNV